MSQSLKYALLTFLLTLLSIPVVVSSEPVSGSPSPITTLPRGWKGECRDQPQTLAYCAVWRDSSGPIRLLATANPTDVYDRVTIRLILPDSTFALQKTYNNDGRLIYMSMKTFFTGDDAGAFVAFLYLHEKDGGLPLTLERGATKQDIRLPPDGMREALDQLRSASSRLRKKLYGIPYGPSPK
jgi:hypothetical protein